MSDAPGVACRGCRAPLPAPFLDLGRLPPANRYVRPSDAHLPEPTFPLEVAFCPTCALVQLVHTLPPEDLFGDYPYYSSTSTSFLAHAEALAESLCRRLALGSGSRVVEVASNDGYLLQFFLARGVRTLGVDPARNLAEAARKKGIPTLERFFGPGVPEEIAQVFGPADLLVANNVLAHAPDIHGFLGAVRDTLAPGGTAVFEFPWVGSLLASHAFDTVYHEHVFYLSLSALDSVARSEALSVVDVEHTPVHGGSLRVFLRGEGTPSPAVRTLLDEERSLGLLDEAVFRALSDESRHVRTELRALLERLRHEGRSVAAYGAPAKGNTLLGASGIGRDLIAFTVDRSESKQGLLLPGSHIPVYPPEALLERRPDYAVLLPWNLRDEILEQQRPYIEAGGRFIEPIPRPRILEVHP